jgi:imidazolonepropionase
MTAYALAEIDAATMEEGAEPYGLIRDALIAIEDGQIAWIGPREQAPAPVRALPVQKQEGRLVTPGLIDCHTHIVNGGDRAREFEMRLEGASY